MIEGARMLGLEDRIGSLTVGKQADIVLVDASRINLRPVMDPAASVSSFMLARATSNPCSSRARRSSEVGGCYG